MKKAKKQAPKSKKVGMVEFMGKLAEERAEERAGRQADKEVLKAVKAIKGAKPTKAKAEPKAKVAREPRRTMTSAAREMIIAGKSNEDVLEMLNKEFGVNLETHKNYAGWYRAQCVRLKLISKADADESRHS